MYDMVHLESQWRAYKRKRVLVPAIIVLVLIGLTLSGYFFWLSITNYTDNKSETLGSRASQTRPEAPKRASANRPPISSASSVTASSHKSKGWQMTFSDENVSPQAPEVVPPKRHVNIQVTTKKSATSAKEIEERFRFAKDKDDALFLARYYYEKKAYKKALKWALETNKLDSDIEESWLIFGQAKARLGQRMEAIRVLQAYYDRTGSPKAQKLLDAIRRGKTP